MLDRSGPNDDTTEQGGPDIASWYDEYHVRLLKYLRSNLRTECDAQDISQEVFLRLLRVPEDRVIEHPRAYLFRVAANVVNDWLAGQTMVETRSPDDLDKYPGPDNTDTEYVRRKRRAQVRQAIDALPMLYRATLLLKLHHGMSYKEIAGHLDVSERMVKRYIVKAYARLRLVLTEPA